MNNKIKRWIFNIALLLIPVIIYITGTLLDTPYLTYIFYASLVIVTIVLLIIKTEFTSTLGEKPRIHFSFKKIEDKTTLPPYPEKK